MLDLATFPKPVPAHPPRLVSEADVARILVTAHLLRASRQNRLHAPSIRLALLLWFCCRLRRGELLGLQLARFDADPGVLRIEATKFRKSRLARLSASVQDELQRYVAQRRAQGWPDAETTSVHFSEGRWPQRQVS